MAVCSHYLVILKSLLTARNVPISRNDFYVFLAHPKLMSVGVLMDVEILA